jgi:hypothetical protein
VTCIGYLLSAHVCLASYVPGPCWGENQLYQDPIDHWTVYLPMHLVQHSQVAPDSISIVHEQIHNNRSEIDEPGMAAHQEVVLDLVMLELIVEAY